MRHALIIFVLAPLVLAGCSLPEDVRITNHTEYSLYVHLALPYPAYEMLNNDYRYSVRIEPGESWSTDDASSHDRADLEILQPNEFALLRLYQYGNTGWSAFAIEPAAELFVVDPVHVTVDATNDGAFAIKAIDERGAAVPVTAIDDSMWFAKP